MLETTAAALPDYIGHGAIIGCTGIEGEITGAWLTTRLLWDRAASWWGREPAIEVHIAGRQLLMGIDHPVTVL
jgi:hypothetical protein